MVPLELQRVEPKHMLRHSMANLGSGTDGRTSVVKGLRYSLPLKTNVSKTLFRFLLQERHGSWRINTFITLGCRGMPPQVTTLIYSIMREISWPLVREISAHTRNV
jgi:hypothetical protein